ncbi:hypothetical protein LCGC14_2435430, partial [marine sediment metagenome]
MSEGLKAGLVESAKEMGAKKNTIKKINSMPGCEDDKDIEVKGRGVTKKTDYQVHMSDCMKGGKDMKTCAVDWKDKKPSNGGAVKEVAQTLAGGGEGENGLLCASITMIGEASCPNCQDVKEVLKEEISRGDIKVKSLHYGEGKKIAKELGIDAVPTFV